MVQIFSTFKHSLHIELAISYLEQSGISKDHIFAVPLSNRKTERKLFDSMHEVDGISLINTGAVLGTAFAVIGASIGFKLQWGPIYWGLIGTATGFILGLLINLFYYKVIKKRKHLLQQGKISEVILIVECSENQSDTVESILWHHFALGLSKVQS